MGENKLKVLSDRLFVFAKEGMKFKLSVTTKSYLISVIFKEDNYVLIFSLLDEVKLGCFFYRKVQTRMIYDKTSFKRR